MKKPLLSIIILNFNGAHHLRECFDSILQQQTTDVEIILVDNASKDDSVSMTVNQYPQIRVIQNTNNLGFAQGNNVAIPAAKGEYIFFLNNDTVLEEGCLSHIVTRIEENRSRAAPRLEVYAPMMVRCDHRDIVDSGGDEIYTSGAVFKYAGYRADHPVFQGERIVACGCGGAVVYPKTLLEELNGFDPDFFLIFEDVDLSLRARHAGADIVFLPHARVAHKGSASVGNQSPTQMYFGTRNLLLAKLKSYPTLTLLKHAPMGLLTALLGCRRAIIQRQTKEYLRARFDQLTMLPAVLRKRRQILSSSRIDRKEFERWLRRGWLRERIELHFGGGPNRMR